MNIGVRTSKKIKNKLQLSIVIPVYNEESSIFHLLYAYKKFGKKYHFELLCVDNGSTDDSGKVLKECARRNEFSFIKNVTVKKNIGYGHGIMTGVRKAAGEVVAWTHADMQTHPADVFRAYDIYQKIGSELSIIKGNRTNRPFFDSIISTSMGIIATVMLKKNLHEINAQPKLFHKTLIKNLNYPPDDFMLDLYLLYIVKKLGYTVHEIPVVFHKRRHGKSKWAFSFRSRLKMIQRTMSYLLEIKKQTL